jgi:hypothetical protein
MSKGKWKNKQSQGLGDTIAKVTEAIGIDKIMPDDCGCEERKQKLNELFAYKLKVVNCPTKEDENWFKELNNTLNNQDRKKLCELYAHTFNLPYFEPCLNCSPKPYIAMIDSLKKVIV